MICMYLSKEDAEAIKNWRDCTCDTNPCPKWADVIDIICCNRITEIKGIIYKNE